TALALSPDGRVLVSGGADRTARAWDAATGDSLGPPLEHKGVVTRIAFSPDGKTLLTSSIDEPGRRWTARLWDVATGKSRGPGLLHQGEVTAAAFSPDGKTVVTGSEVTARLWDVDTGKPRGPGRLHQGEVTAAAFSPDGKSILTGSKDQTARFWETATGEPIGAPLRHGFKVWAVAFSPDGQFALTGSGTDDSNLFQPSWQTGSGFRSGKDSKPQNGEARVWETATRRPIGPPLRHDSKVRGVGFSPDGRTLLCVSDDALRFSEVPRPGPELTVDVDHIVLWTQAVTGLELEPNGNVRSLSA